MAQPKTISHRSSPTISRSESPGRLFCWALRLLLAAALAASSYLAWASLTHKEALYGCVALPFFDCESIFTSRWAYLLGMPVSLAAVGIYALMLGASFFIGMDASQRPRQVLWSLLVVCAVAAACSAFWFVALMATASEKFCLWCLTVHLCGSASAALILSYVVMQNRRHFNSQWLQTLGSVAAITASPGRKTPAPARYAASGAFVPLGSLVGMGVASVAVLIVGQILFPPKTYKITSSPRLAKSVPALNPVEAARSEPPAPTARPTPAPSNSAANKQPDPAPPPESEPEFRTIEILNGQVKLDTRAFPVIGRRDAKHFLVEMSDYSCPHCRELNRYLDEAMKRYGEQFAVVVLLTPLNGGCNRYVPSPVAGHEHSCEYARLALAVWRADPAKFRAFHEWMMSGERPPDVARARAKAEELVGAESLAAAEKEPAVNKTLDYCVELYQTTQAGPLPKLLFYNQVFLGRVSDAGQLFPFLEKFLEMRPIAP